MKIDVSDSLRALEHLFKSITESPFDPRRYAVLVLSQFVEDGLTITHHLQAKLFELSLLDRRVGVYDFLLTVTATADKFLWESCGRRVGDPALRYRFVQSKGMLEIEEVDESPDLLTWLETYSQSGYVPSRETLQLVNAYVNDCKIRTA